MPQMDASDLLSLKSGHVVKIIGGKYDNHWARFDSWPKRMWKTKILAKANLIIEPAGGPKQTITISIKNIDFDPKFIHVNELTDRGIGIEAFEHGYDYVLQRLVSPGAQDAVVKPAVRPVNEEVNETTNKGMARVNEEGTNEATMNEIYDNNNSNSKQSRNLPMTSNEEVYDPEEIVVEAIGFNPFAQSVGSTELRGIIVQMLIQMDIMKKRLDQVEGILEQNGIKLPNKNI